MKNQKFIIASLTLIFLTANISAQTGGTFAITQSVVAGGGGQNSTGGAFSVDGTTGQSAAGNAVGNTPFAVTSGFWNFTAMAPTAANVGIGGRVITANGNGIRNVVVILTAPNGTSRTIQTGTFGYFKFEEVEVGGTYIISVYSKRYGFSQPTRILSVQEEIADLEFVANDR
jgi:Carboxypeptidase regulatory-like domain